MRAAAHPIPLPGVPDGLEARPLVRLRTGGEGDHVEVRDRRGRRKTDAVLLVAAEPPSEPDAAVASLGGADLGFLLGAGRREWATVVARYGDAAWATAVRLARLGAVAIEIPVDDALRLGTPRRWTLTEAWQRHRATTSAQRAELRQSWTRRAAAAAVAVDAVCPELARALRSGLSRAALAVLVCAAEDLAAGTRHDGARAFSQSHFGDAKVRDDAAAVLARAGVPDWVAERLGVVRSARLGLGGPITVTANDTRIPLRGVDGPILFRAEQAGLRAVLDEQVPLVIVENLQAAEAICDRHDDVAVVYTAGQPGDAALRLLGQLAAQAARLAVIPDADLGGVRIAERVLAVVPDAAVIDVGRQPHTPGAAWTSDGAAVTGLRAALDGPAGSLAAACLQRGYPVEQEALVAGAVAEWLAGLREVG